jgi:hypothetical protein
MKRRKKGLQESELLHKIKLGINRRDQLAQGAFDGRYRTRSVDSSKVYKRSTLRRESPFSDI